MLKPQLIDLPAFDLLAATGRGMDNGSLERAARQGFSELMTALHAGGLMASATSCVALMGDEPQGLDDQQARMLCGMVFGLDLAERSGRSIRPDLPLTGTLAWITVPAGRHAVFVHAGPYSGLHGTWTAIYRDWAPATGYALRDTPPFEHYVNDAQSTPQEQLITHIHIPLD